MRILRKLFRAGLAAFALCLLAAGATVAWVETSCVSQVVGQHNEKPAYDINEAGYKRAEGDSYLTFPEWSIVHAYEDLAGVMRAASESQFDYIGSVRGFWKGLCVGTQVASRSGQVTMDQKITNYIIGFSFTLEMAAKGLYERTLGALTAWLQGGSRTPEDVFALKVADDYAAFLKQTPWYQFPFAQTLQRFWRDVPLQGGNVWRKIERRFGLTLEYGVKVIYAQAIGFLAGYSPADLTIRSVFTGLTPDMIASDSRLKLVRPLPDGAVLVETPRYREFTAILRDLGPKNVALTEIAGNRRILTTILAPDTLKLDLPGGTELFRLPIQSRPGWRRIGVDTEVAALIGQIASVEKQGAVFEHAYDY